MRKGGGEGGGRGGERLSRSNPVNLDRCSMPMDDLALHRFLAETEKQRQRIMGELIRGERKILRLVTEGTPRSQGFLVRCLPQKPPSMDTRRHRSSRGTHQTDVMNQTTFPRELCGFGTICIVGTQKKCIPVEPKRLWGGILEEQEGRKAPLVCAQWDRE